MNLPVPDYDTQERIANYLDEEIAKSTAPSSIKILLIELLEENVRGFCIFKGTMFHFDRCWLIC